jgi:hypothetical protein
VGLAFGGFAGRNTYFKSEARSTTNLPDKNPKFETTFKIQKSNVQNDLVGRSAVRDMCCAKSGWRINL